MFFQYLCLFAEAPGRRSTKLHEISLNIRVGSCDFVDRLV